MRSEREKVGLETYAFLAFFFFFCSMVLLRLFFVPSLLTFPVRRVALRRQFRFRLRCVSLFVFAVVSPGFQLLAMHLDRP